MYGLGLAVIGSIIGAWLGGRWYAWRSPSFAGDLDHLGSAFGGGLVGCVAGALIGSVVLGQAHVPGRVAVAASVGCVAAAGLFAIAVWQIGAFTDADGPSGLRPYVGIALAPVAAGMVWFIVRWTRSPDNGD